MGPQNSPIEKSPIQSPQSLTEPDKKCKHLPIIIALAILAVGGFGFGGYEFYQNIQKDDEIKNLQTKGAQAEGEDDGSQGTKSETIYGQYGTYLENLSKNYKTGIYGYYYHYTGSDNVLRAIYANINNGVLTIKDSDGDRGVVFERSGYTSVYYARTGNGGEPHFYLISVDGTVSRIDISEDSDYKPKKLDYKNIVSIFEGADLYAWLIDIDGNIYKDAGL